MNFSPDFNKSVSKIKSENRQVRVPVCVVKKELRQNNFLLKVEIFSYILAPGPVSGFRSTNPIESGSYLDLYNDVSRSYQGRKGSSR
jgi:hypothetical protein